MANPSEKCRPGKFKAKLKESEEWFSAIFDGSRDAIFLTNAFGCFVEVNIAAEILTGYSKQELLQMSIPDLHDAEDLNAYNDFFDRIMSGEDIMSESVIRRKDGSYVTTEFSNRRIIVGKDHFMHTIARDITERKHSEILLKDSEIRYKTLFQNSGNSIIIVDKKGVYLCVNDKAASNMGQYPEEIQGRSMFDFLPNDVADKYLKRNLEVIESGVGQEYEDTFHLPGGDKTFLIVDQILFDSNGEGYALQSSSFDITERRLAEEALHDYDERLRQILENSHDVAYRRNLKTDTYDFLSAGILDISGFSAEEMMTMPVEEILERIHPDETVDIGKIINDSIANPGKHFEVEYRFRHKETEQYVWFQDRFTTALDDRQVPLHSYGHVRDITEQKKASQKLHDSEKRYRNLVEKSPVGIGIYQNGLFVYINETGLKIMGCKDQKDILGKPVLSFVHPDSQTEVKSRMQIVAGGVAVSPLEEKLIRHDGTVLYAEVTSVSTVYNEKPAGQILVKDISDRKRTEKELLESDSKYRLLSEQSGIGVGLFSPEGKIIYFNEQALKNLGGILPEYTGKTLAEVFGEENGKEYLARIVKAIKTGKHYDYEDCVETPTGKYWFLSNFTRICDPDGCVIGVQVVSQDINELKRIQTALKHASDYNRSLIEASLDPMVTIGPDGKILDVNKATQEITGYSRQKLIGTDFSAYFTDPAKAQSGYQEVFSSGFVRDYALEIKRKKGGIVPVLYNATLYRNEEAKVAGVFAAARDISELKKVEDALKKKEANLRSLIENSNWSIWSVNRSFDLIEANSTFIENFKTGTGRTLALGDNVTDGLPASIKKDWIKYYKKCLSGEHFTIQTYTQPPVGLYYMNYSFNPITTKEGEMIGLTIIGQNISDLKKTEEKLKQSANQLRELSRHVEDLMEKEKNQIAHDLHDDLGQKLTALNMDLSWLKSRIGVQSRTVESKIQEMSQILNDSFESLRKISYGLRPSILDNLGLYPAIEWLLSEFKKSTGVNYSLSFVPKEKEIDNKLSLVVFRIIQESLTNVARHSRATKVTVKIKADSEKLKLIVMDNGIGFDSGVLKNRQSFGLLGMQERARSYGGEVVIRGKAGKGTVVSLEIPVKTIQ